MKKLMIMALFVASVLSLSACKEEKKEEKPIVVDVIEVKKEPHANSYEFSGFTSAEDTVEIRARVSGYILERKFTEGEYVKKGQKLFLIEPYTYEANLKNAQGAVLAAKATVEKTALDLARAEQLLKNGNTSKSTYDAAKASYDNARAQQMQAEASLQIAELNMKYTNVEAPVSGRISLSNFDVGNLVGPESGVLTTIVNSNPINVNIGISEDFLVKFSQYLTSAKERKKISLKMILRDGSTHDSEGRIDSFDVLLNTSTNTVNAKIKFPNDGHTILPGQYAKITMLEPVAENRAVIPQSAVTITQGKDFVMVAAKDGTISSRLITKGQEIGSNIIVESGLDDGELVVTNFLQKIRTGMKVKYRKVDFNSNAPAKPQQNEKGK